METAAYLYNCLPSTILRGHSPFEMMFKKTPNYEKLRIFGCLCFPWLKPYSEHKLQPPSRECLFLGYAPGQSAYRCYDLVNKRMFISRHVRFDEFSFSGKNFFFNDESNSLVRERASVDNLISPVVISKVAYDKGSQEKSPITPTFQHVTSNEITPSSLNYRCSGSWQPDQPSLPPDSSQTSSQRSLVQSPVHLPESFDDVSVDKIQPLTHVNTDIPPDRVHSMTTRSMNNIYKPKLYKSYAATKHPLPDLVEPTCVSTAIKDPNWRMAMSEEFNSLLRHGTWELVPSSLATNIIGCRWVFRLKRKPDGSIDKYKARLVAKGFHQRPGLDYIETFSLVVKPVTIRSVLSIALMYNWQIRQLDVSNAFLHGSLSEVVFMHQPPGFVDSMYPSHVCRLRKIIYGLRQPFREWHIALRNALIELGFIQSKSDTALFLYHRGSVHLFLLVYVDDILFTGSDNKLIVIIIAKLSESFALKDLGQLSYFLGIEVLHCK
ncbi:hypothetical protein AgCh_021702 [Apium graveolens]